MIPPDHLRYSCQIALPGFGEASQQLLQQAKVLVVGAGGLGCPAAQYLVAAGVGTLGIADFDTISINNLHRQVLYTPEDIGLKKAAVACEWLQKQNPGIQLVPHDIRVTSANVVSIMNAYDIVVDGTDNFDTRYLLNDAAVITGKPIVYGAIYQFEGQVAIWNIINADGTQTPNYRDLFPKIDATQIPNCTDGGVIPTLAGIIGCMQANEVIKYITKTGELLAGKLLVFDALTLQSRIIKIGNITNSNITTLIETIFISTMSVSEVRKGLRENSLDLVDVRTDQERDIIDIGGIHIEADQLEGNLDHLDDKKIKVLYCSSGKRSGEAVKFIKQKWPDAPVFSLQGGLKAWFEFGN